MTRAHTDHAHICRKRHLGKGGKEKKKKRSLKKKKERKTCCQDPGILLAEQKLILDSHVKRTGLSQSVQLPPHAPSLAPRTAVF